MIRIHRILAIAKKEGIHILRDWRSLLLAISTPVLLLTLFGYALTLDVDQVPMGVLDQDNTPTSRDFISHFSGSRYFNLKYNANTTDELQRLIDKDAISIALVVPYDFTKKIKRKESVAVQVIADASDSNTATLSLGYADTITRDYIQQPSPIDLETRIWYNPDLVSRNNIVPGLIAMILMVVTALLTSLTIAREWERGTMEMLISTPVKRLELLLGKMAPYFIIGCINITLVILMGQYLFDVPMRGSFLFLALMSVIFLVGALSLGIAISVVAKNQLAASQIAMISTFLPSFFLSGFVNKISNMPDAVQVVTYFVPARYFVELLRSIYLKGVGLEILYPQALFLLIFSAGMLTIAYRIFHKKLTD